MTVSSLLLPLLQEEVITHWSAEIIQRVYKEPLLPPIRSMLSNGLLSEGGMAPCVVSLPIINSIIASDEEKTCMDGLLCFLSKCVGNKEIPTNQFLSIVRTFVKCYGSKLKPSRDEVLRLLQQFDSKNVLVNVIKGMVSKLFTVSWNKQSFQRQRET